MTEWQIDRRALLQLGVLGLGAMSVPGIAQIIAARGFTHGVASGEPTATSVLLWTRYVSANDTDLMAEISDVPDFRRVVAGGKAMARGGADHTAKIILGGLQPGRSYYYRFVAPDGTASSIGRTRTLPAGRPAHFTLATFSCANMGFGYFNAYAHAAARNDIDLAVHVGDYFYEYPYGTYPSKAQWVTGRAIQPDTETIALADYRLRYASYRADRDLARLHQMVPMIARWDDHELANDAWRGGAQNHQPEEGDWAARQSAAIRAYREWMPVRDDIGAGLSHYAIGDLADIFVPETRLYRDQPFDLAAVVAGASDPVAALRQFRDGQWMDPAHTLFGPSQSAALASALADSHRRGTRWQVLAQQLVMAEQVAPPEAMGWQGNNAPDFVRQRYQMNEWARQVGMTSNMDGWGGYPAEREALLASVQSAGADLVVLAGDSHNAWGSQLTHDGRPVGVEFAGSSVSSAGMENNTRGVSEADRVAAIRRANPALVYANTQHRGYMTTVFERKRATNHWHLMDTVKARSTRLAKTDSLTVRRGAHRFV